MPEQGIFQCNLGFIMTSDIRWIQRFDSQIKNENCWNISTERELGYEKDACGIYHFLFAAYLRVFGNRAI